MTNLIKLGLGLLEVCDNSVVRGRAKFNQIARAVDAIVFYCTKHDFTPEEAKEAQLFLAEVQQEMGAQSWRLNSAITRVQMFNKTQDTPTE